jgi:hypothetical protein
VLLLNLFFGGGASDIGDADIWEGGLGGVTVTATASPEKRTRSRGQLQEQWLSLILALFSSSYLPFMTLVLCCAYGWDSIAEGLPRAEWSILGEISLPSRALRELHLHLSTRVVIVSRAFNNNY